MKPHPEITKIDRLRVVLGSCLAVVGLIALFFAALNTFSSLPLTLSGILFVLSGVLIAGSHRLATFISEIMR